MARQAATVRKTNARAGGRGGTLALVILAVAGLAALPFSMLMVPGMMPTAVAFFVDNRRGHYLARTVAATNLAGMVLPAMTLVTSGFGFMTSLQVLREPRNWLIMYGAAAMGWIIHAMMPPIAHVIIDMRAEQDKRRLLREAELLVAEWGDGVGPQPPK
jgi:hypothetical protein